jgi:hypothetical protein
MITSSDTRLLSMIRSKSTASSHPSVVAQPKNNPLLQLRSLAEKTRYIEALSAYLHTDPTQNAAAVNAYAVAMGSLHQKYPADVKAQAFCGLGLSAAAMLDPNDPIAADRRALAVLVPGFKAHPDHPGFAHYIIHTCDNPQLAREALPAAEKYAAIAAASAHALYMLGHIFARLGMWPHAAWHVAARHYGKS